MRAVPVWATAMAALLVSAIPAQQRLLSSRTVLVTVSTGARTLVDLGVDDFVVEESGVAREVFDVHIADYPLVVMMDDGAEANLDAIRNATARFITRVGDRAVAVGTLAGPALLATFDDDRAKVLSEIRAAGSQRSARSMQFEALAGAARVVQETGAPFSAVVIVSDRAIDPTDVASSELLTPILESRIPFHVIAHRSAAVAGQAQAQAGGDVLHDVSSLTRGQYTTIYSAASYPIALDRLADRLATEMMVQFLVPPDSTSAGSVRVGVKIPGARVMVLGLSR